MDFLQEALKVIWYSHLFKNFPQFKKKKNFPQFTVIHTVKDFGIVNDAE